MIFSRLFDGRRFCRVYRCVVLALAVCCCCLCSCFPILRTAEKIRECGVTHYVMGDVDDDVVYVQREKGSQVRMEGKEERFFVKMKLLPYDCSPHWWGIASFSPSLPGTYSRDFSVPVESAYVEVNKIWADRLTGYSKEKKDALFSFSPFSLASGFDPKSGRIYGRVVGKQVCDDAPPESFVQNVESGYRRYKILKQDEPVWMVKAAAVVTRTTIDAPVLIVSMVTSPVWGGVYCLFNPGCLQ